MSSPVDRALAVASAIWAGSLDPDAEEAWEAAENLVAASPCHHVCGTCESCRAGVELNDAMCGR